MPLYEYSCSECGLEFEVILKKMRDLVPCTGCGASAGKRLSIPAHEEYEGDGVAVNEFPDGDRIIGRDAEKRWRVYEARNEVKQGVRHQYRTWGLNRVYEDRADRGEVKFGTNLDQLPSKEDLAKEYTPLAKDLLQKRDVVFREGIEGGHFNQMGKD